MKIFIQYINNKFINNLTNIDNHTIVSGAINSNLYAIHYKYDFDAYIFASVLLNREIEQFISEFYQQKKLFIYHPHTIDDAIVDEYKTYCTNISHTDHKDTVKIPLLINDTTFSNQNLERNNKIICFIDDYFDVPKTLQNVLYPNSKYPIQIVGSKIKHHQYIGDATESEKAYLLNTCDAYLDIDSNYRTEAVLCGTKIVTIDNDTLKPLEHSIPEQHTTYAKFIEELISGSVQ